MFRSFLSWRYLVSRPTNLIGIVGILVAVGALILILSIMTGFLEESRKTLRGTLSDLIIAPIPDQREPGDPPESPGPLLAAVRADPRVAGAAPQLVWFGTLMQPERGRMFERLASSQIGGDLLVVQLVGIDVDGLSRLASLAARVAVRCLGGVAPRLSVHDELDATAFLASVAGDPEDPDGSWTVAPVHPLFPFAPPRGYRPPGRVKASILVGEQLFGQLDLQVGEEVQIATAVVDPAREDFATNNREFVVAGTFRTRENETDLGRIYMDRRELANFLGDTRSFSQVLVRLEDYERDAAAVSRDLKQTLEEKGLILGGTTSEVRTWEEFRGSLLGAIENERVLMGIMLSLVLVVAGFTIFAILSMMVTEKRRDIGILCALGAAPRGILQLFLMIAFWDALLGGLAGAVLGTWGAIQIDPIERWLSSTFGIQIFNRDVYLFDHIPSIVQPLAVGLIVFGAFACALVFAAIPAWRAARLDPLQALRYE